MGNPFGDKNEFVTDMTEGTGQAWYTNPVGIKYVAIAGVKHKVYAWREHQFNDPTLHVKVYADACKLEFGNNAVVGWDMNAKATVQLASIYIPRKSFRTIYNKFKI